MDLKNKNGIKNDLHLSHIEAKVDFTETINNTYRDVVQPIAQKTGKGVAFCFEFLTNKIKPYMYEKVEEAKYKCKEIDKKLEKKYSKIPDENKTMPRTCIIGPALDVLKYNLDEEHIKEIFVNILTNEMDTRNQSKVLPAYINIVNQLSKQDAEFLKLFKDNNCDIFRSIRLELRHFQNNGVSQLDKYILITKGLSEIPSILRTLKLNELIIDNLIRLNLIYTTYSEWYTYNENLYENLFNMISNNIKISQGEMCTYSKGFVKLTEFGKNFIDICLS